MQIQEHRLIGYQPVFQRVIETANVDISELRVNKIVVVDNNYLVIVFLYDIFVFSASESVVVAHRKTKRQIDSADHGMSRSVLWIGEGYMSECYVVTAHGQLFKAFEGKTKNCIISQYSTQDQIFIISKEHNALLQLNLQTVTKKANGATEFITDLQSKEYPAPQTCVLEQFMGPYTIKCQSNTIMNVNLEEEQLEIEASSERTRALEITNFTSYAPPTSTTY